MNRKLLDDTVAKINSDDTKPLNELLGETTDTGGTATTGTVSAKLNALINGSKFKSHKYTVVNVPASQTDYVMINVTGAGEFYGAYGTVMSITFIIDGVETVLVSNGSIRCFMPNVNSNIFALTNVYLFGQFPYIPFKESLIVKVTSTVDASDVKVAYSLYE